MLIGHTVCTLVVFRITPLVGTSFATWNKGVQERVSLTSAVLGNMKEVKLLGLTNRWAVDIQAHRVRELDLSKKARILSVYRVFLSKFSKTHSDLIEFFNVTYSCSFNES